MPRAKQVRTVTNSLVQQFQEQVDQTLGKIQEPEDFRASSQAVEFVFNVADKLLNTPLDTLSTDWLLRHGGKLVAAYAFLGQLEARARAVKEVYEQKYEEMYSKVTIDRLQESKDKITQAKTTAKIEVMELKDFVIRKSYDYENCKNTVAACDKMISFTQTAIKVKENERFRSRDMQDNG